MVEAVWAARERQRDRPKILLISTPPRHGKSTLISEYAPAWYLGSFPDQRVILASYEADFAAGWGGRARAVMERWGEALYGARVDARSNSARRWEIEGRRGGMVACGVGGPITGRGGRSARAAGGGGALAGPLLAPLPSEHEAGARRLLVLGPLSGAPEPRGGRGL